MGQGEPQAADDARDRLIQTARAMVLRGDNNFSIATLCSEAQMDRNLFRLYFSGKTALMAAVMHEQALQPALVAAAQPQIEHQLQPQIEPQVQPQIERQPQPQPQSQPQSQTESQTPKVVQEPSVPTPDAWLERRLRVFERALTALESRAEETARNNARVIAQLEEKLSVLGSEPAEPRPPSRLPKTAGSRNAEENPANEKPAEEKPTSRGGEPVMLRAALRAMAPTPGPVTSVSVTPDPVTPAPATTAAVAPARLRTAHWSDAAPIAQAETLDNVRLPPDLLPEEEEEEQAERPSAEILAIAPSTAPSVSKQEMADVLESARAGARAAAAISDSEEQPSEGNRRLRWLVIGAATLVALFLGIGLTLGHGAIRKDRVADWHGGGLSRSHAAQGALAQTIASADFGDAKAEARLALAYLRGQGVARDASAALRWSQAAAKAGEPAAQYLLGALYQQGAAVKADPVQAFAWFNAAADKGNLKAMHNLAIAYAEGVGTAKDEARAAQWFTKAAERGYVDSAFDLAVMYERGAGVPQDLVQALKWYGIAARAGDQPSKARADFLRGQMSAENAKRAMDAVTAFAPLPALPEANTL